MNPTVERIETTVFGLPMHSALQWGKSSALAEVRHVAVRVCLSDGSEGWAEAPPRPTIYGETVHSITAVIRHELAPRVAGLRAWDEAAVAAAGAAAGAAWDARAVQAIQARLHEVKHNHTAKAAVDMALHAALAQHRGLTLAEHLGATAARLRVSYILGIGDRDTVLAEARRVVDQGVRVLKVKVGRDWAEDLARIGELQTELGPDVDLYADANECLDADAAPGILSRLAERGLLYCEEPLPVEQIRARAHLRSAQRLPLIADDSVFTRRDLARELDFDTFDILNIKTARTGFTESAAMLAQALAAGKGAMVGSQASAGLGTIMAAHFAARPGIDYPSELSFVLKLQADILDRELRFTDGYLDLAQVAAARLDPARLRAASVPLA
jgi:L-alanine-DL-glutamate epimerase-like enolase superfamily enzyme